jgi:hypothetical protein
MDVNLQHHLFNNNLQHLLLNNNLLLLNNNLQHLLLNNNLFGVVVDGQLKTNNFHLYYSSPSHFLVTVGQQTADDNIWQIKARFLVTIKTSIHKPLSLVWKL